MGIIIQIVVGISVYQYFKYKIRKDESFSCLGWGIFAGLFMGGIADICVYNATKKVFMEQLVIWNKGKSKKKQEENAKTVDRSLKDLRNGIIVSVVILVIVYALIGASTANATM